MKHVISLTVLAISLALPAALPALAKNDGKLPKNAKPLTEEEAKAIYSGKTIDWQPSRVYWRPDGTAIGFNPKKGQEYFTEGTWTARGNEVCLHLEWHGPNKAKPPYLEDLCAKYYSDGKKIWVENTKDDPQYMGDIWTGIEKKLKKGDTASEQALALKAKFGY